MGATCVMCGSAMNKVSSKEVGDTTYVVYRCPKCHHQIAREE